MLRIIANPKRFKEQLEALAAEIVEVKKDLVIFNIVKNETDKARASAEWLLAKAEAKLADAEAKLARADAQAKRLDKEAKLLLDARRRELDAEAGTHPRTRSPIRSCLCETARGSGGDEEPTLAMPENIPFVQAEI
jgi:chromosome segregation ATPase